ncbi:FtsW/RodA/SpoVE family cell cycle protein [Paenibacillus arenilitoris]|uniref:FtsW/RodA/SpoVE family cell cycle protein n=1 Tax=Paenibacillus arenilitoris TaxID=2772299 RepID=A0A927CRS1_9BACL|nr:FtsW/RodA/SpoVE family cell cycle protein [Paenibacillus arenilitoris]MBD2871658.1 FtsW/RodA/SpoVE family cell cycle protein [Paenibacillus arenilitoris]
MSKEWSRNEAVGQFLKQVCGHIKAKEVHEEIRLEMLSHLDELVEDKLREGVTEEEAVRQALERMGDPDQIGKQLHAAHKPVFEWSLAVLVAIMVGISLSVMYAMKFTLIDEYGLVDRYFQHKSVYVAAGVIVLIAIYFMDYRTLKKYSWYLYILNIVLVLGGSEFGQQINGSGRWLGIGSIGFDVYALSPYLFMVAIAGTLTLQANKPTAHRSQWVAIGKMTVLYFLVPVLLYTANRSLIPLVIYGLSVMALIWLVAKNYKLLLAGLVSYIVGGSGFLLSNPHYYYMLMERLQAFLHPHSEPGGYMTLKALHFIQSAGMWGQGFGVENRMIPYVYGDMIFTYLIYSLGWVFGAAMVVLILVLAGRAINVSRQLRDPYARGLVVGLFSIIGIHYLWNMLMSVGLLPIAGMPMPFISYGGTRTVAELAAVGVILGVYRRKNRLSRASAEITGS